MDSLAAAFTALEDDLERRRALAQAAVDEAFEGALARYAPRVSGTLSGSAHATAGGVSLARYGLTVAYGRAPTASSARAKAARARYSATVGRQIAHPNDFIRRAWADPAVVAVRDAYPDLTFTLTIP